MPNILITHFTWSGNPEQFAGQFQKATAGGLYYGSKLTAMICVEHAPKVRKLS